MPSRTVTVGSSVGLHAKPAGLISAAVFDSGETVTFSLSDRPEIEPVDASSALVLMTLGAQHGETVVIECENESVLDLIAGMVHRDLTDAPSPRHAAPQLGSSA